MAQARKGSKINSKLAFLIFGKQGTWKSSLCLDFAKMTRPDGTPFRVLYIDAESGSIDDRLELLEEEGINLENIYIIYTQSLKEVQMYLKKIANKEKFYELDEDGEETEEIIKDADGNDFFPDAVVIDGTTILFITQQESLLRLSEKRASVKANKNNLLGDEKVVQIQNAGLELKDWNRLRFVGNDLVLNLLALDIHFAITAREKTATTNIKTGDKVENVSTGEVIPDGFKELGYNVKTVLHTYSEEDGTISAQVLGKDRTRMFTQNEIISRPSLTAWQPVIDKSKGRKSFILSNNIEKSIQKDKIIYEQEIMGISNATTGSVQDEKQVGNVNILEEIRNVFKALSPTKKKAFIPAVSKIVDIQKASELSNITDEEKLKEILEVVQKL
jgi:hypothetical protein